MQQERIIVIRDGNGCTDDVDYIVYPQLQLTPTTETMDCSAAPNATIALVPSVETPAQIYTYEVILTQVVCSHTNPYSAALQVHMSLGN
jgi:hypothetical protein